MKADQLKNVNIGDELIVTHRGRNKGKIGIVRHLSTDTGFVWLEPKNCSFELSNKELKKYEIDKVKWYMFKYTQVNFIEKEIEPNRIIGWIVAESKQEAIDALEKMLEQMKLCDDDVDIVNMHIRKIDL
jgi:ribosomal protein L24